MRVAQGAQGHIARENSSLASVDTRLHDVRALPAPHLDDALPLELAVRLTDGVGIDTQFTGELPDRRKRIIGGKCSDHERATHLVNNLDVDGAWVVCVDGNEHGPCVLVY